MSLPRLTEPSKDMLARRGLGTLSTHHPGGWIHVTPVGFLWDGSETITILTSRNSQKARNVRRRSDATVSQVEGPLWVTFVGDARVIEDPAAIRAAEARYAVRYGRQPRVNPERVLIVVKVQRILGSRSALDRPS